MPSYKFSLKTFRKTDAGKEGIAVRAGSYVVFDQLHIVQARSNSTTADLNRKGYRKR